MAELMKIISELEIEELKGVDIEGEIELELESSVVTLAAGIPPEVLQAMGSELAQAMARLQAVASALGIPAVPPAPAVPTAPAVAAPPLIVPKVVELIKTKFSVKPEKYPMQIQEVVLGATSKDGGTRSHTIKLGGQKAMPYYTFDDAIPNRPNVTLDVFDMPMTFAKAVKVHYEDVMNSPAEWAKKAVEKFNADLVTIHLVSTDPMIKDTPAKEAVKVVEEVLQAVKVPIVIGGSGNPKKDPEVLEKAAEVAEGERCMIASANLNMDFQRVAAAAKKHGHAILSWTQMDINAQKELNRKLMKTCRIERKDIIMDPTTAALGYGLDYAFTNMERIRIAGLKGDGDLAFPMSSGTTNAWGARESWMTASPLAQDSDWGPREYRGPIWEISTGMTLALAGVDIFMMMHPAAVATLKQLTQSLLGKIDSTQLDVSNWVSKEV